MYFLNLLVFCLKKNINEILIDTTKIRIMNSLK